MCYQQGRCWRGFYFLLSTLSNRTAYGASKGAEFLQLRGTEIYNISQLPQPYLHILLNQAKSSPCFPWTVWEHWALGKMGWKQKLVCSTATDWDLHSLATRHTSPHVCVSHGYTHLVEDSEELKLLLMVSSSPSLLSQTQDKWRDAVWQGHCHTSFGASLRDCYCVSVPLTAC